MQGLCLFCLFVRDYNYLLGVLNSSIFFLLFKLSIDIGHEVQKQNKLLEEMVSHFGHILLWGRKYNVSLRCT